MVPAGESVTREDSLSRGLEPEGYDIATGQVWSGVLPQMLTDIFRHDAEGRLVSNPTADPATVACVVVAAMSDIIVNDSYYSYSDSVPSSNDKAVFAYALALLEDSVVATVRGHNIYHAQQYWNNFRDKSFAMIRNRKMLGRSALVNVDFKLPNMPDSDFDPLQAASAVNVSLLGKVDGNIANHIRSSRVVFEGPVDVNARVANYAKGTKFTFMNGFYQPKKESHSFSQAESVSVSFNGYAEGVIGRVIGKSTIKRGDEAGANSGRGILHVAGSSGLVKLVGSKYTNTVPGLPDLDYDTHWTRFRDRAATALRLA